jgi:hypothetical protein
LYFGDPAPSPQATQPDAGVPPSDAAALCPDPGTRATISYPADGATNVPQPVPIQNTIFRPLDVDESFGAWLSDANGTYVPLTDDTYDPDCSSEISQKPTDPVVWTECYANLAPGATYIWHVNVECYGDTSDTILELTTATFTTAK